MSILTLHIISIFFAAAILLFADKEAFAWMKGKKQTLDSGRMKLLHYLMWAALLSLVVTGTLLLLPQYPYLLTQPLFIIKLLFVGILVANAALIGNLMHTAFNKPFTALTAREKLELYASGGISAIGWVSVVSIGLYLFY